MYKHIFVFVFFNIGKFKAPYYLNDFVYNDRQAQLSFIINGIIKGGFGTYPLHPRLS